MAGSEATMAREVVIAFVGCLLIVALGIAFLDKPLSTWSHQTFEQARPWFDGLTHIVDPLPPLASLGIIGAVVAVLCGWQPGRTSQVAITCCVSIFIVVTLKDQAKFAFGRLWPETWVDHNPSWIGNAQYGFSPFHGGRGWSSFPSGHMAVITAPSAVIWRTLPRLRWVVATAAALVALGLFGADFHFFSDIVAGTFFGAAVGVGSIAMVARNWTLVASAVPGRAPAHTGSMSIGERHRG